MTAAVAQTVEVPAVLTTSDLAARWQVSEEWVQDAAKAGRIPGFKVGRAWRFRVDAVLAHEECEVCGAAPADVVHRSPGTAGRCRWAALRTRRGRRARARTSSPALRRR